LNKTDSILQNALLAWKRSVGHNYSQFFLAKGGTKWNGKF